MPEGPPREPAKLLNRNFYLLWQGQSINSLGNQAFDVAMLFWAKHSTGSATLMGLMLTAASLPAVLLGPIGGALADRYPRRTILILADLFGAAAVLALAGLVFAAPQRTSLIVAGLFLTCISLAVVQAFFSPAALAALPDLVPRERLSGANSLLQLSAQFTLFVGQGLGGTLFRLLGAPLLFLANGLSFLFAAASNTLVTIPQRLPDRSSHWRERLREFRQDIAEGLRYIVGRSGLRDLVLLSALLNFLAVPVIVLLPFYVEDHLRVTVDWYGFFLASYGAGSMAGYLLAGTLGLKGRARARLMLTLMVLEPAGYALLGLLRQAPPAVALAGLGGVANGIIDVYVTTIVQASTPGEIRGRVFGLLATIAGSTTPIATGLAGVVADLTGHNIPLIYVMSGGAMAAISAVAWLRPRLRSFLAYEEPAEVVQAEPVPPPT